MLSPSDVIHETVSRLAKLKIRRGSRLAIWAANRVEVVYCIAVAWRLGAVVMPLSTRMTRMQVETAMDGMGCDLLVVDREREGDIDLESLFVDCGAVFGGVCWEELELDLESQASIVLTSGSTGEPKGVLHMLTNHYYSALGSHENIPFGPEDTWLVSLPLYHMGGLALVMRALLMGGCLAFPKQGEDLGEAMLRTGATHVSLVPTQLKRLNKMGGGQLKAVLVGGAACASCLVEEAVANGLPVFLTYGSTEMASQVTTTALGEAAQYPNCSGSVLPYREIKFAEDGEILVRGETRFHGYIMGGGLVSPFDDEGWFATGDVGECDEQGLLYIRGRKDTMFISGGENIYPEEIERALMACLDCEACVVVPVVHAAYGQRPVAFVKTDKPLPQREDLDLALERFKWPDFLYSWPVDVPVTGKPDRVDFTDRARSLV